MGHRSNRLDLIARAASLYPLPRRPVGPLIVCYHGIGGSDGLPRDEFRRQVDALLGRRTIVPLREAVELLGSASATTIAAITFDDGYRDYLEEAVPILEEHALHATLFVPAGHIGGRNEWDAGLREERRLLDAKALHDLDPATTEVGVHGHSHCRLRALTPEGLHTEISLAKEMVEDASGRPASLLAYPYGLADDFDRAAEHAVEAAGFLAACSAAFGRGSRPEERFRLRRVTIGEQDSLEVVERKFDGAYDWTAAKERVAARLRRARRSP